MKASRGASLVWLERTWRDGKAADQPIYQRVAGELTARIASGAFPVGTFLATEMELYDEYDVSRSTIREALRQLRDTGLISRRRRIGTEVLARTPPVNSRQPINSIADLLQYAENAGRDSLEHAHSRGCAPGERARVPQRARVAAHQESAHRGAQPSAHLHDDGVCGRNTAAHPGAPRHHDRCPRRRIPPIALRT